MNSKYSTHSYLDFICQFPSFSFFVSSSFKPSLPHAHLPVGMHPSRRLVCRSLSRGGGTSFTFSYREERTTWSPDGKMRSQALSAAGHKPSLDQPLKTRIFTEERSGTLGGPILHRRRPHETLQEAVEAAAAIRARQAKAVHTKIKAVDHKGVNWRCPHAGCAASFANQDVLARHQTGLALRRQRKAHQRILLLPRLIHHHRRRHVRRHSSLVPLFDPPSRSW